MVPPLPPPPPTPEPTYIYQHRPFFLSFLWRFAWNRFTEERWLLPSLIPFIATQSSSFLSSVSLLEILVIPPLLPGRFVWNARNEGSEFLFLSFRLLLLCKFAFKINDRRKRFAEISAYISFQLSILSWLPGADAISHPFHILSSLPLLFL